MRLADMKELQHPKDFVAMPETETVYEAARAMAAADEHAVLVMNNGDLRGIFTEHDLVTKVIAEDRDLRKLPLGEVMTTNIIKAGMDENAHDVMYRLDYHPHAQVPVLDDNGKVVALLRSSDFAVYTAPEAIGRSVEATRATVTAKYQPFMILTAVIAWALIIFLIAAMMGLIGV